MTCSTKALFKKFNQIRKQNWSAPTTMSVFIIICMIFIFSFESLGLMNKEKNLNMRYDLLEEGLKLAHNPDEKEVNEVKKDDSLNSIDLRRISDAERANRNIKLLMDSAYSQYLYESSLINKDNLSQEENMMMIKKLEIINMSNRTDSDTNSKIDKLFDLLDF